MLSITATIQGSNASHHCALVLFLLGMTAFFAGCNPTGAGPASSPIVEFTSVPAAGAGNPGKPQATISGRVRSAQPGQKIVIYARAETQWWVQPRADQPFTRIDRGSKWSNATHPGSEYAALLVGPGFIPPPTAATLPTDGVIAFAVTHGSEPFWRRWWFLPACLIVAAIVTLGVHRLRLRQLSRKLHLRFEERLAERTRVAQELHDTLLQGVLSASMQLHVAVDQLPDDSPAKPGLNRVLQLMGQVIDEGRNTLRGLRSATNTHDLESAFSRVPQELGVPSGIDFRVIVEGQPSPLRSVIRDDVYGVGREAMVNAFRHSRPKNIGVQLEYAPSHLRVVIRDDGCGIDPRVLESGRDGHFGLSGMRERAQRIGARLKVFSRPGNGTEVELRVPGNIAFESHRAPQASNWFKKLYTKTARTNRGKMNDRGSQKEGR